MIVADGLDHPISLKLCKRLNRFFEALTFLTSLQKACGRGIQEKAPSETSEAGEDHNRVLECFINKLAQICDNKRRGPTVTSLAIVRPPDKLLYVFASNQRSTEDAEEAREFVLSILSYVNRECAMPGFRGDESSPVFRHLLRNILEFNHERIRYYRQSLLESIPQCLVDCTRFASEENDSLREALLAFQQTALITPTGSDNVDDSGMIVSSSNEDLVRAVTALRQSTTFNNIAERCKAGKIDESRHWCELQHFIGRLVSYFRAVQAILGARKHHPELFDMEDLEIRFINASKPIPNPMNAFQAGLPPDQRTTARSAGVIISRMTSDEVQQEAYRRYADELQRCGLDNLIARQCYTKSFRPIVHSEVLLLEWLQTEFAEETHSIPFYNDIKYIGCSKPTCRLCEYYFAAHNSGVRVRPSHRNVYANWVVPDVLVEGETSQYKAKMIDSVLAKIRDDVFLALREKVSVRKRFDSETCSSLPTYQSVTGVSTDLGGLASLVEGLSLAGPVHASHWEVARNKSIGDDAWSVVAQDENDKGDDDDDDDDGGGTLVFTGRNTRIQALLRLSK
ncbi:hypothetical protein CSUB01_11274 [Colletotrichum sublineola]|uniref:Uncharacterized protein n=1 Tax=Colletotrichum sublineola TaxID=1173701 RepID=A0A066Y257_COLSU|nr:hypothetical protein CSUB01_11274 [Colletotrichum sublineola]